MNTKAESPKSLYGIYQLKSIESPCLRIIKEHKCVLELMESGIEYHIIRTAEQCDRVDGTGIWVEEYQNWRFAARRRNLAAIDLFYSPLKKWWILQIEVKGVEQGFSIYYNNSADAKPLYEVLKRYHFETP